MPRLCIAERERYAEDIRAQVEDIPMEDDPLKVCLGIVEGIITKAQ